MRVCIQGRPATKVRFDLKTGRRHQLRVHSLCLGHGIVGDATYNTPNPSTASALANPYHISSVDIGPALPVSGIHSNSDSSSCRSTEHTHRPHGADRMMLHAYKLK